MLKFTRFKKNTYYNGIIHEIDTINHLIKFRMIFISLLTIINMKFKRFKDLKVEWFYINLNYYRHVEI